MSDTGTGKPYILKATRILSNRLEPVNGLTFSSTAVTAANVGGKKSRQLLKVPI